MNRAILSLFILVVSGCSSLQQRYEDLRNPTEYVFDASREKVLDTLRDPHRKLAPPPEPLHGVFREDGDSVYGFGFFDFYTTRYWGGRQETREEVVPSEAGRIGTIQGQFRVRVTSRNEKQTLVSVIVYSFEQQVDRSYRMLPHFHKGPVFVDVRSDTYFEYLFLLRLGELLGQKGMPSIKGEAGKGVRF